MRYSRKWTRSVTSKQVWMSGRYEALLQMADLVVHHHGVPELLPELAKRLHKVAEFRDCQFFTLRSRQKSNADALLGGQ